MCKAAGVYHHVISDASSWGHFICCSAGRRPWNKQITEAAISLIWVHSVAGPVYTLSAEETTSLEKRNDINRKCSTSCDRFSAFSLLWHPKLGWGLSLLYSLLYLGPQAWLPLVYTIMHLSHQGKAKNAHRKPAFIHSHHAYTNSQSHAITCEMKRTKHLATTSAQEACTSSLKSPTDSWDFLYLFTQLRHIRDILSIRKQLSFLLVKLSRPSLEGKLPILGSAC